MLKKGEKIVFLTIFQLSNKCDKNKGEHNSNKSIILCNKQFFNYSKKISDVLFYSKSYWNIVKIKLLINPFNFATIWHEGPVSIWRVFLISINQNTNTHQTYRQSILNMQFCVQELVSIPSKSRDWKGIFISLLVIVREGSI